jgi:myo-inositol-1(or 4)-monophosphatase
MNSADKTEADFLEEVLDFAESLSIDAGKRALEMRNAGLLTQDYKQSVELVTSADLEVSQMIENGIKERYPSHAFFTEESEGAADRRPDLSEPTWIVDPIDGTVGYARGHFQFCISIAFCLEGKIQVGVVYCPALDELFTATKGNGAFLNGKPIRVSATKHLENSLVATGFPHGWAGIDRVIKRLGEVRNRCRDVRRSGSAAFDLVWVACGRIDAYYEEGTKAWDICAGKLIAIEAGANHGFFDDNLKGELSEIRGYAILAANPFVFPELLEIIDIRSVKE